MKTTIKKNMKTNEDIFTISTSYEPMNYDEEGLMFIDFHTTKSATVLLNEKQLGILIDVLKTNKAFLSEMNKQKNIK